MDALIGCDVIRREGLEIVRRNHGIDLRLGTILPTRVSVISKFQVSGLNERQEAIVNEILEEARVQHSPVVTTGKLYIKLTDNIPVDSCR